MQIRWVVKGPNGAVQFLVFTDWLLPHVQEERMDGHKQTVIGLQPMGADVGYHSPKPMYEGQASYESCPYLDGRDCYYDGSGCRADEWVREILLPRGGEAVWEALENEYIRLFDSNSIANPDKITSD